jgi:ESS family glutamate:Na+ symporter
LLRTVCFACLFISRTLQNLQLSAFSSFMTCNESVVNSCGVNGVCSNDTATGPTCFCLNGYTLIRGICTERQNALPYSGVASFCWLCFLLVLGKLLRLYCWIFQKLYLPASVIGGILGLITLQLASLNGNVSAFIKLNFTQGW